MATVPSRLSHEDAPKQRNFGLASSVPSDLPASSSDILSDAFPPRRPPTNGSNLSYSSNSHSTLPSTYTPPSLFPSEPQSLSGIASRAFCLGLVSGGSLLLTFLPLPAAIPVGPLAFWAFALALFHFLEFWVTARYNTGCATVSSFLLTSNGLPYTLSQVFASLEYIVASYRSRNYHTYAKENIGGWPAPFSPHVYRGLGLVLVLAGQVVRTFAMRRAGKSFNHTVQLRRGENHVLVTEGIYAWLRHPAYFGFFWWAVGTQIWLGNRVMLAVYILVLWRFFAGRIEGEEQTLVIFFGDAYKKYRERTRVGIPFIH